MYQFHVDLYSTSSEEALKNTEFSAIVSANDAEGVIQRAKSELQGKMPGFIPASSWGWAVYEMPLGQFLTAYLTKRNTAAENTWSLCFALES